MAFLAGLLPQQTFGLLNTLRDVCLIPHHEVVDHFGVEMRNGLAKSTIEHQGMATGAMLGVGGRRVGRTVAIRACQLDGTGGAFQIALQMHLVTKLDGPRIGHVLWPHGSELGMSAVEGRDVCSQVSVALRTRIITCCG